MKCPCCNTENLKATKLEAGLSAMGCPQCQGALVSLLYYRDWTERDEPVATTEDVSAEAVNDSHAALSCPKCGKLMTKYRIDGCQNNRLDLCASCDEAWLDGGEWELLKSLELSHLMPKVFTEQWQRKLREQALELSREERLANKIDPADLERAKQMREWLKDHPNKTDIIFYLNYT